MHIIFLLVIKQTSLKLSKSLSKICSKSFTGIDLFPTPTIPSTGGLYSLEVKKEKLYTVSKNKTGS